MTQKTMPLLGLCPIGKFVFSHEDALRCKRELQARLGQWGVRYVDLEGVLPDGIVRSQQHVEPVVAHMKAAGAECLFMPHCNFGTEGAVGMIARRLGLPVLLWGPRDEAPLPDGRRLRDSLCGLFASSKVLGKLKVPFTYVENCRIDDQPLRTGLDMFLRATAAAGVLRGGARVGLIGQRIDFFWTTIVNESQLLERFGVQVHPVDMVEFIAAARDRAEKGRSGYVRQAGEFRQAWTVEGYGDDQPLINVLAVRDQMLAVAGDLGLDALAVQDFNSLVDAMGTYCLAANSIVGDVLPVAMESDVHGAISLLMARRAAAGAPAFLSDITIRHPDDDNGVLMWHCGAPLSMKHPDDRPRLGAHWILPSPLAGMTHFRLADGPVTVARFDGDGDRYSLAAGHGQSMPGPATQNNYLWMKVDNWPRWERTLMEGPFIHHAAMVYGHHAAALIEACKYVPQLAAVPLGDV